MLRWAYIKYVLQPTLEHQLAHKEIYTAMYEKQTTEQRIDH